ncbi:hypothetical protein ACFX2C_002463 [Malus domestica]
MCKEESHQKGSRLFYPGDDVPYKKSKTTCAPHPVVEGEIQGSREKDFHNPPTKASGQEQINTGYSASYAARRMVTRSQQGDQRIVVQSNLAEEFTPGKEPLVNNVPEEENGGPVPIDVEEIKETVAVDSDNFLGGGGWPNTAIGNQ